MQPEHPVVVIDIECDLRRRAGFGHPPVGCLRQRDAAGGRQQGNQNGDGAKHGELLQNAVTDGGCHVTESQDQTANLLASLANLGSEELKIGLEQGLYGEQQRPLVELELRRRQQGDQEEHEIAQLRQRVAELEQALRDNDTKLRSSTTLAKIAMVIAGIFFAVWLVEVAPIIWQVIIGL
jgi:hypothetical protein